MRSTIGLLMFLAAAQCKHSEGGQESSDPQSDASSGTFAGNQALRQASFVVREKMCSNADNMAQMEQVFENSPDNIKNVKAYYKKMLTAFSQRRVNFNASEIESNRAEVLADPKYRELDYLDSQTAADLGSVTFR